MRKSTLAAWQLLTNLEKKNYHTKTEKIWQQFFAQAKASLKVNREDDFFSKENLATLASNELELGATKIKIFVLESYNNYVGSMNKRIENIMTEMKNAHKNQTNKSISQMLQKIKEEQFIHNELRRELNWVLLSLSKLEMKILA